MITVIDYKMINLGSILNMLKKVGAKDIIVATEASHLTDASKIIMPGVGSFDSAMTNLKNQNLLEPLRQKALVEKIPFLGICLGMQLMTESSEEGKLPGLSLVKGRVKKFQFQSSERLRIPHMGWNQAKLQKETKLFSTPEEKRFYFVHSYYVVCDSPEDVLVYTDHGKDFVSAFEHENLIGVQFHPEKSHHYGLELFKNFAEKY